MRILHVMRAPVGGLFRHVADLSRAQTASGHAVGIVTDQNRGSGAAEATLHELSGSLEFGVTRIPMSRHIGLRDLPVLHAVALRARETDADVLHGHGAKGGAYARLAGGNSIKVYTPHGGSLHFSKRSLVGFSYLATERWLNRRADLIVFESEYARRTFAKKVTEPRLARIVYNGISPAELDPVRRDDDAHDFVFMGELRKLKGPDLMLSALALLAADGWGGSALFYGDGPDRKELEARAANLGLKSQCHFPGTAPAREAFASGHVLVIPSRAESLPYIVLEAAGAGIPIVATRVGGIPEIFGPDADQLVAPDDPKELAAAMKRIRSERPAALVRRLHERVAKVFSVDAMVAGVLAAYADAGASPVNGKQSI